MERAEIETTVKEILGRELGIEATAVGPDTTVENCPLWDSVKHVDIVFAIQDAFGLKFHPREIEEMYSYPEINFSRRGPRLQHAGLRIDAVIAGGTACVRGSTLECRVKPPFR
jgi:acyl carrier protein